MKEKVSLKRTVVPTSKSCLLLCNYYKNSFTHCKKQKDRLAFPSVFFQSIDGINFSLKGMSKKTCVSRKAFLCWRNTHAPEIRRLQGGPSRGLHQQPHCPRLCQQPRAALQPGKAFNQRITACLRQGGTSEGKSSLVQDPAQSSASPSVTGCCVRFEHLQCPTASLGALPCVQSLC